MNNQEAINNPPQQVNAQQAVQQNPQDQNNQNINHQINPQPQHQQIHEQQAINQINQGPVIAENHLLKIACQNGNQPAFICFNQNCQKLSFMCENQLKCSCHQAHKYCHYAKLNSVVNQLNSRKSAFQPIKQNIKQLIEQLINQLSVFKKRLQDEIETKYEQICLNQEQIQFIQSIKKGAIQSINGKKVWRIIDKLDFNQRVESITNKIQRDMKSTWHLFKIQLNKFKQNFQQRLNRCTLIKQNPFFKSQVITRIEQINRVNGFFQGKIVSNAELIYRASQNQFQIQRFFDTCSFKKHTLTLIKTQFNRIIGGYNPFVWLKSENDVYATDQSVSSFIFSLSNNQKLTLLNNSGQNAIHRYPNYGPMWGAGTDLAIYNKANENNNSQSNICTTYANENYRQEDRILYDRFTGTSNAGDSKFRVIEWEVWELKLLQAK